MRKIDKRDVLRLVFVLVLVAGISFAMGAIGRFVPTHKIVEPVYCGSCHPEQVEELNETTHLADFAERIERAVENTNPDAEVSAARYISGGCQMCHNYWDNFKWFGLKNVNVSIIEEDYPALGMIQSEGDPRDIYGNAVSPYGLASTKSYIMNVTGKKFLSGTYINDPDSIVDEADAVSGITPWNQIVLAWPAGLDVYQYEYGGNTYSRLDYVWSRLSALSPGPVGFNVIDNDTGLSLGGCGTAEKGLCHAAADAVSLSFQGYKREFPEFPNTADGSNVSLNINGQQGTVTGINPANMKTLTGSGTFFQHEMAFTTAQYAAKPVKICGACHVFKLPPMRWGGEPWAVKDVWDFSRKEEPGVDTNAIVNGADYYDDQGNLIGTGYGLDEPFGFRPTYNDLTGDANVVAEVHQRIGSTTYNFEKEFNVRFRTPDWAHANIPCIRCHVHAGINDKTVAGEIDITYEGKAPPSPTMPSPGSAPGAQPYSDYTQEE